ncbi:hypothetical protein [Treponema bryantii]|uniref:hypothetical protein n=1 Tax=Treponema bryantii TaxID=163 RepID=UPI002B302E44|nr:hypothetical protein TRBR_20880 [Treponema bryantii]
MKKSFLSILLLALFVGFISCKNQKENVTPEQLCFDIQKIQLDMEYSSLRELYDPEPFEQLKADVMAGKADRLECFFRIQKILKEYKCLHLNLSPLDSSVLYSKMLPFYFYCFGNDYHIYWTIPEYQKYLGWKLVKIGECSVEEARRRLLNLSVYSYETVTGEKYDLDAPLSYVKFQSAGLVEKNGKVSFSLESRDGEIKTIKCKALKPSKIKRFVKITPEKANNFNHYDTSKNYRIVTSEEKKALYVQYNRCLEDESYTCQKWFADIISELQTGKYNTVVFDLRYNPGGYATMEFMINNELWRYKSEFDKYNLAMITSGRTASCATWFMNDFIRNYPDVKIFGEETGEAVFNYTNRPLTNKLNALNCDFAFPKQLDEDVPELYKRAREVTHSDVHRGTLPDVEVFEKFEDFMNGEDTIYNAIYEYFQK